MPTKSKKLIIAGAANNAKLARFYFERDTEYSVHGFAVHREYIKTKEFEGLPVFAIEDLVKSHPPGSFDVFVAIGYTKMNSVRASLYDECKRLGYRLPNYVSPRCSFLTDGKIGDNNFILEDNTIQPFVEIGSNNVLWSGNHIGHDVKIGNHCFLTSHVVVSGFTRIGDFSFLGVNSTLRDDITIAPRTLIAAGAIVMKDTKEGEVHVPARSLVIEKKSDEVEI